MLPRDHEVFLVDVYLESNPRLVPESEDLLRHVEKVSDVIARTFKIAGSSWLIIAMDTLVSIIGTDFSLPFEKVSLWKINIGESWLKNGIGFRVLHLESSSGDCCE